MAKMVSPQEELRDRLHYMLAVTTRSAGMLRREMFSACIKDKA
jgi:hypothetical protein